MNTSHSLLCPIPGRVIMHYHSSLFSCIHLLEMSGRTPTSGLSVHATRLVLEHEISIATFTYSRYHVSFLTSLRQARRLSNESGKCFRDAAHYLLYTYLPRT